MQKTLKVVMIGAGSMAPEHIRAFSAQKDVEIVGICNRTVEKAQSLADEFGIKTVAGSVAELAALTSADLAVMAVYEPAIEKIALEVFEHDWAVLMEKPIGLDLKAATRVYEASKKRDKPVFVGLNRRTLSSTLAALKDLNAHGASRFIHVQDQQSLETARIIGHAEPVVKNWMFANSIHLVDYIHALGRGEIESINVLEPWSFKNPSRVIAHISFSSGDSAVYEAHWNAPAPWAVTVTTAERRWELRPLENARYQDAGTRILNDVEKADVDIQFKPGFFQQAANVIAALRGQGSDAVTISEAFKTTQLVAKIYG